MEHACAFHVICFASMDVYAAIGIWGLALGGAATLFQTALANSAGDAADVTQSMLVTAWNAAIAGGGIVGGALLDRFGVSAFSPALLMLLIAALWWHRPRGWTARRGKHGRMASDDRLVVPDIPQWREQHFMDGPVCCRGVC